MTKKLTEGNPAKLILVFTIPLLIGNIFQQFYSMADTFIVGRTIGVQALAAVGCTGSISFLILGFVMGVSSGLAIVAAQRFGARDEAGLRKSVATSVLVAFIVSVIVTAVSVPFAMNILRLMHTPQEIIQGAYDYIVIILAATGINMMFNLLANIIRALGDSKTPLIFLIIACIINIVLDYVFILEIGMGVKGAAWATVIAQTVSALMCLWYIKKKLPVLHLKKEDWKVTGRDVAQHVRVAIPMGLQMSIIAIGAVVVQYVLNGLGHIAVAAYTAAGKIDQIAVQPMMSFGTTMATYTAQNYGAGRIDRIKKGVLQCVLISGGFSILIGLVNILAGYQLTGLFLGRGAEDVQRYAQTYLHISGSLYLFLSLLLILRLTLQGLGQSMVPTISGFMELIMRVFAATYLGGIMGFTGVCWSSPLAWIGAFIPLAAAYIVTMRRLTKKMTPMEESSYKKCATLL